MVVTSVFTSTSMIVIILDLQHVCYVSRRIKETCLVKLMLARIPQVNFIREALRNPRRIGILGCPKVTM